MVIAIWGRDGVGKSTLSDTLGVFFEKKGTCIVIDTDLTQPTLAMRQSSEAKKVMKSPQSLGRALAGTVVTDIRSYLHQHPANKGLFYAGLQDGDDFLSYELGLNALNNASDFVDRCVEQADTVILDLSGQRNDPFLPAAFEAEHIILPIIPDLQGICWYLSVRPLLQSVGAMERVLPVAALQQLCHYIDGVEKAGEFRFVSAFPWIREIAERRDDGLPAINNRKYVNALLPLLDKLKGSAADA